MDTLAEVLAQLKNDAEIIGPPGPAGPRGEQGTPGKMPMVKLWVPETGFYAGDVVAYDGGTFQARRDTGQPPSLPTGSVSPLPAATARASRCAARSTGPQTITALTLSLSTAAASSRSRMPLVPARVPVGSLSPARASAARAGEKGERGPPGPKGDPGASRATILGWKIDCACYLATPLMSDGSDGPQLELYRLFEQFLLETS